MVAKEHQDRLKELKKNVEESYQYFKDNYDRYHDFTKFVFKTSISEDERKTLFELGKPDSEYNILESFVSRLRGEFAKQQPNLKVRAADGVPVQALNDELTKTIDVVEAHLRAIFFDSNNDKLEYNIYSDLLAGGFSVMEVFTDYVNDMSFEQNIIIDRAFDPTLCGFDPLARDSHKGDGSYCYKVYPKTKEQFKKEFPKVDISNMKYSKNLEGFGWSYRNEQQEIILICDYFEKKTKEFTLVKLSNGASIDKKDYDKVLKDWDSDDNPDRLLVPPSIVRKRKSEKTIIVRYRLVENQVIDYKETNFKHLPLVFVDGNSVQITESQNQYQMTRPYVYHAKGIQQLKNFAGQSLANELENLVQHKFIVALESIPNQYAEAYQDVQKADTLIYNHFLDRNSPDVTLPPPREVVRPQIPAEITNTFRLSDEMTQVILGSYDSTLGVNKNDISGAAIAMGAMQSNNASVPYIVGYIKGLNRIAQIIIDLIPKYYRTPRSLPIMQKNGQRDYYEINTPSSLYMNYDSNFLQVKVETGVNFAMQKELALKTIVNLMQASEKFADFINKKGLFALLDNIDIRGIEELKKKALIYEQEEDKKQESMQQMQQQLQQQQAQLQIARQEAETQKARAEAQKAQAESMLKQKEVQAPSKSQIDLLKVQSDANEKQIKLQQNQQSLDMKMTELMAMLDDKDVQMQLRESEIDAENARSAIDALHELVKIQETAASAKNQAIENANKILSQNASNENDVDNDGQ